MVGVPGRSKGCVTCRRRKKGCDLGRPTCGQCKEKGLVCGGYDRDRIFVNQYPRAASERTAPPADTNQNLGSLMPFEDNASLQLQRRSPSKAGRFSILLPEDLARSAYREKSVEAFFDMYIPDNNPAIRGLETFKLRGFASLLPLLYVRDEALRMALLAIGTAAAGKRAGNMAMMQQGKEMYGRALQEMGKALKSPERARSDALLAVPRVMGLFEILFGADVNPGIQARSWRSHAEGELAMILSRGPEGLADGIAHQLFVDGRLHPIIAAIRMRKATILNKNEWKTFPWTKHTKTSKDLLLDVLAGVPEVIGDVENLHRNPSQADMLRPNALTKAWQIHNKLDQWLATHKSDIYTPATEDPIPIKFPDLPTAHLTVHYWVTCTFLYQCIDDMLGVPISSISTSHPDRPHPRAYARRIARSVMYFFQEAFGILGATMISFPLGGAMLYMTRNKIDEPWKKMVVKAWMDPKLPSAIRDFLNSMRSETSDLHEQGRPAS